MGVVLICYLVQHVRNGWEVVDPKNVQPECVGIVFLEYLRHVQNPTRIHPHFQRIKNHAQIMRRMTHVIRTRIKRLR